MNKLLCELYKNEMKITLTSDFIRYIHQNYMNIYLELLLIEFIRTKRHCLQSQPPEDFGISC